MEDSGALADTGEVVCVASRRGDRRVPVLPRVSCPRTRAVLGRLSETGARV